MGEIRIDLTNESGNGKDEFQSFVISSRTGRRNAIPDILGGGNNNNSSSEKASINVVHLTQQLENLKTQNGINDGNISIIVFPVSHFHCFSQII